jgi:hypothetical protein
MAFTFRIRFSGLCAFVPDEPFNSEPKQIQKQIQVLLPNVLKARSVTPSQKPDPDEVPETDQFILPPHLPMLTFDMKNLRPSDGQPSFFIKDRLDIGERFGMLLMLQEDIVLDPKAPEPGGLQMNNVPVDFSKAPTKEQRRSLLWLSRIDKALLGQTPTVDSALTGPFGSLGSQEQRIISRIFLKSGLLSTNRLSEPGWQYLEINDPIKKGNGRRVAIELALELQTEEPVEISFQNFRSGQTGRMLFSPPQDSKDDVEITIQNLEPDIFLGVPQGEPAPHLDPDFSVYYGLLQGLSPTAKRPILRRFKGPTGKIEGEVEGSSGNSKPCAPSGITG